MLFCWICHHELRVHYIVIISLVFQLPVTFSVLLIFSMIFSHTHPPRYPHVIRSLLEQDFFRLTPYSIKFTVFKVLVISVYDSKRCANKRHLKLLLRSLATNTSY